jgi:uncharacterized membrane protein
MKEYLGYVYEPKRRKTLYVVDVQERTMQKRALVAVCLLLTSASLAGVLYQTGDVPTEGTVPLYVYAVVLVVVISVVAVVYHNAGTGEDTEDKSAKEAAEVPDEEATEEPKSDDERVLRMIESEGGRMKQKRVVEETGWSEAKVSKLTSRMEDEGDITKIRLGRENILETTDEKDGENEEPPI